MLIVDDHDDFRARARMVLEGQGFEIAGEAADGATAVVAVVELQPDVVLLDIQLPDANGFDLVEILGAGDRAPIVILTSSRDEADYGTRVARSGARGFIPKDRLMGSALAELLKR